MRLDLQPLHRAVHRDGAIVDIVSYTRSANSVGLISRCRCCNRAIDVSAIIDVRRRLSAADRVAERAHRRAPPPEHERRLGGLGGLLDILGRGSARMAFHRSLPRFVFVSGATSAV